jgi:hypothetical protein
MLAPFAPLRFFHLIWIGAVVGAALVVPAQAAPKPGQVFTILNVNVDTTARTAADARELALADGQAEAFRRLVARLVPERERARVPPPDQGAVAELVRDFQVDSEKTSSVRYLATLRIRFERAAVRRLLRGLGVSFAETPSKPVLVLPLYRRAGALLLWDAGNLWRRAWSALPPSDGLVPMILPDGGLKDVNDIGPEQAARGDRDPLRAIARRYGAADVLLALASLSTDPATNLAVLQVSVSRFGDVAHDRTIVRSFAADQDQQAGDLLAAAAEAIASEIEEVWKGDNLLRFDEENQLTAVLILGGLADWVRMRRRLARVASVQASNLVSLSRGAATVRISYLGDEEQLILALAQRDVGLVRGAVSWELRFRPGSPRGTPREAPRQDGGNAAGAGGEIKP